MSEAKKLIISIPPYGSFPSTDDIQETLLAHPNPSSGLFTRIVNRVDALEWSDDEQPEPLSEQDFLNSAKSSVARINQILEGVPNEYHEETLKLIDASVHLGMIYRTLEVRVDVLSDLTRERGILQPGRSGGGKNKRGKFKQDTDAVCKFIHEKVAEGRSVRTSASIAATKFRGASADAYRNRYKDWLARQNGRN